MSAALLGNGAALSDDWWKAKDALQAALIKHTASVRGRVFEVGTVKWQHSTSTRPRFTGPWTEERFFNYWVQHNPKMSQVYLPIQWTGNEGIDTIHERRLNDEYINRIMERLDRSYNYFTVIQIANAFQSTIAGWRVPEDLNMTVYATGPAGAPAGMRVVPIPLLKEVLKPRGLDKNLSVTFYGDVRVPVRTMLSEMYQNHSLFQFATHQKDWLSGMERSNFTLAPRGWGHDSFRRWESLQVGTIPIYVYDSPEPWLPYKELLNWDMLSVNVHQDDLGKLAGIVAKLQHSGKAALMQQYIMEHHKYFTYEFMLHYILEDLLGHQDI